VLLPVSQVLASQLQASKLQTFNLLLLKFYTAGFSAANADPHRLNIFGGPVGGTGGLHALRMDLWDSTMNCSLG
jgi:hypothetical protein